MKKLTLAIIMMAVFISQCFAINPVHADPFSFALKGDFELQGGGSIGGAPREMEFRSSNLNAFLRLRQKNLMIGFEGTLILPHGVAVGPIYDVWRSDHVRVHMDMLLYKGWSYLSNTSMHRSFDVVPGTGVEVKVLGNIIFTTDCRFFIPDPRMAVEYGDFYRPVLKKSERGVQLSFGVAIPLDKVWPFNR